MTLSGSVSQVAIVGGAGKIGRRLVPLLREAGLTPVALARRDEQLRELEEAGAIARHLDIEQASADDFTAAFEGCDAVVFTAGGGADGNVERKTTVDLQGSVKSQQAARALGIDRFVQVSAIGIDKPADLERGSAWEAYVHAKRDADEALRQSNLAWTILRPGGLTDDDGTGAVALAPEVERGSIPRDDVAALITACLLSEETVGAQWECVSGDTPIDEAVKGAVA